MRQKAWAVGGVAVALALAASSGVHRRGALLGVAISGLTGLLSMQAMGRFARGGRVVHQALAVMALGFLVRLLLVALGTILVVKTGESVPGFVVAFFVVYFVLAGLEGAYAQRLGRSAGSQA
ncbi:MAG TPA: hypothetical protein VMU15_01610 [Anaeromyxobacter sp.]|nr:hypothetical protein [Anaeromyxobacter sp.]